MELLVAEGITIQHTDAMPVVCNLHLAVSRGMILGLLGKSGSGKSTLLRALAGLQSVNAGSITLNQIPLNALLTKERVRGIAFVAQDYQLFHHKTVVENCVHPLKIVLGMDANKALNRAWQTLRQLQMDSFADRYSHQLSGGQKQCVAIARALSMGSKLLLLDEPNSALDPDSSQQLAKILRDLRDQGYSIVFSTHDLGFASSLADELFTLDEGRLRQTRN